MMTTIKNNEENEEMFSKDDELFLNNWLSQIKKNQSFLIDLCIQNDILIIF